MTRELLGRAPVYEAREGIQKCVASALIMRGNTFLFVRRCTDDFLGGLYELPGGTVRDEESVLEALKREVLEETGLTIKHVLDFLGSVDFVTRRGIAARQFAFLVETNPGDIVLDPDEHDAYRFVTLEEAAALELSDNARAVLSFFAVGGEKH